MASVRQRALFNSSSGPLLLASFVTDANVQIDYVSVALGGNNSMTLTPISSGMMPACPARNVVNCMADPNGASCIRFVRARICVADGSGACNPVQYQPMVSLTGLSFSLPTAIAFARAQSLGYQPGAALCP